MIRSVCAVLLVWGVAAPAGAQSRQVRTKVTPLRAFMGDVVTLEVQVERGADDRLSVPRQTRLTPFEIRRRRVRTQDGPRRERVIDVLTFELITFERGELVVPSAELRLVRQGGQVEMLRTDPARVTIVGRLDGIDSAEPKGNHGPVSVQERRLWPLWVALALLLAVAQFFVLRALARRRMRLHPVAAPAPPPRPPWEIALNKLSGIERSRLVDKGLAKEHYDAVSDVIREYLGALGGFEGLDMTTEEIVTRLQAQLPPGITVRELLGFFAECDLVKFARQPASTAQGQALLDSAVLLVERSQKAVKEQARSSLGTPA